MRPFAERCVDAKLDVPVCTGTVKIFDRRDMLDDESGATTRCSSASCDGRAAAREAGSPSQRLPSTSSHERSSRTSLQASCAPPR